MELNKRKVDILKAIIHSYIDEGEAIGSRTLSKKYDLGISSATIRNEMSDLEDLGYLIKPHTSAGRVPSDKAYRLYVDNILVNKNKSKYYKQIKKILQEEINEMDMFLRNSSRILAQLTKYTSLIIAPQFKKSKLKHVQLVPVSNSKVLIVMIMQNNIVKNVILNLRTPIPENQLNKISNLLNEKLTGLRLDMIDLSMKNRIKEEIYSIRNKYDQRIDDLMKVLISSLNEYDKVDVYSDGLNNMLNFPEYNDTEKIREFLSFVEDKDNIVKLLLKNSDEDLDITIGHENIFDEIRKCSLITATYKFNGITVGKLGVIGPTRMDYKTAIPIVRALSYNINEIIEKNFKEQNKE
ncbi:MAG TPA: heat-inducible transcription repressor HrcA [Clostridiales bacterium]|jgi:heat-inducible transcriptional repressor|nr:heat-inducible transcription repressor HrcA [Clostridiales bacterium]